MSKQKLLFKYWNRIGFLNCWSGLKCCRPLYKVQPYVVRYRRGREFRLMAAVKSVGRVFQTQVQWSSSGSGRVAWRLRPGSSVSNPCPVVVEWFRSSGLEAQTWVECFKPRSSGRRVVQVEWLGGSDLGRVLQIAVYIASSMLSVFLNLATKSARIARWPQYSWKLSYL